MKLSLVLKRLLRNDLESEADEHQDNVELIKELPSRECFLDNDSDPSGDFHRRRRGSQIKQKVLWRA